MSGTKMIVLGVTGSIAAHKAVDLASFLAKAGFDVAAQGFSEGAACPIPERAQQSA